MIRKDCRKNPARPVRRAARLLLCLLLCLTLAPSAGLCAAKKDASAPLIRVLLKRLALTDRTDLILDGSYTVRTGTGADLLLPRGSTVTVQVRDDRLYLFTRGMSMSAGDSLSFLRVSVPDKEAGGVRFERKGALYPGDLRLTVSGGQLQPVLELSVERYLEGVVPYEMSNDFPLEALKAQAVCARTYAIARRSPQKAYDVTDTTADQVYKGSVSGHRRTEQAIAETAGLIVTYRGAIAGCYYSASNGGQTEIPAHVWSGAESRGCYAVTDDPYDLENPESIRKKARLNKNGKDLKSAFLALVREQIMKRPEMEGYADGESCFRVDGISAVSLSEPRFAAPSRLMTRLTLTVTVSARKPLSADTVSAPVADEDTEDILLFATPSPAPAGDPAPATPALTDFLPAGEFTVGLELFPDALRALGLSVYGADNEIVTVEEDKNSFTLYAGRYGHGVGMSQRGAQWMASRYRKGFEEILSFYYPGSALKRAASEEPALPTADPRLAETPGPAATPTPRPTLMPVTETGLPDGAWLASVENIEDNSSLNLRAEPSQAGEILMRLYRHQRLIVLETCEDPEWVRVRTDSAEGYVMVSFLQKAE